jgi:CHASE2 domain-containing sensor protein
MPASPRILAALRPFARKGPGHWIRFAVLLAIGCYVGHELSGSAWLTQARYKLYHDQLQMRNRGELYPQRTALVLLDDEDYWGDEFQARSPLKRNALAQLLFRLKEVGVNTVAIDIDLRSPHPEDSSFDFSDYRKEDDEFVDAIEAMCVAHQHVVLASSISFDGNGYHEMPSIYTKSLSRIPCVQKGYIQLPFDMRRIPGTLNLADGQALDSLSLAVTGIADPIAHDAVAKETDNGFRFSEYLTVQDFRDRDGRKYIFSGQDLKTMNPVELKAQLADKLVFIGANWHVDARCPDLQHPDPALCVGPMADSHESPGGLEPGVILHANYVEAMLDRTGTFAPMADVTGEVLEVLMALGLSLIGVLEIHSAWKWAAFSSSCVLSLLLAYVLLQDLGIFLDFLVPYMILVFHTIAEEFMRLLKERRGQEPTVLKAEVAR